MRCLVTGGAGFAGSHLVDALLARGHAVDALAHTQDRVRASRDGRLAWHFADLRDRAAVTAAVEDARPEAIFHLGGLSDVGGSWADAGQTLETNILGTFHVLKAAGGVAPFPRVLIVGSAEIYGAVAADRLPIQEEQVPFPSTPYAVSKLAQEQVGAQAADRGYPVLLPRPFNHTGPRQAPSFVCSSFARQVALIERGEMPPRLVVGNLRARRDFTDARDTVRAYITVLERGRPGRPYNICTGQAVAIQTILETLLRMGRCPIEIVVDPQRFRPADVPVLMGDPGRITRELGWHPEIPLQRTLADLLDYWRAETAGSPPETMSGKGDARGGAGP